MEDTRVADNGRSELTVREMGRLGGLANGRKHDHAHFVAVGQLGGRVVSERYGHEHFVSVGQKAAAAVRQRRAAQQELAAAAVAFFNSAPARAQQTPEGRRLAKALTDVTL